MAGEGARVTKPGRVVWWEVPGIRSEDVWLVCAYPVIPLVLKF